MLMIRTCPTCGSKRIRLLHRAVTENVSGETYRVPSVPVHECPDCGERLYGREAMHKLESYRKRHLIGAAP